MLRNGNDERVLKNFRDLRASEEAHAPAFDRVWRTARAAADPQHKPHSRLIMALAMIAVAAVASALTIVATQSPIVPPTNIAADPPPLSSPAPANASATIESPNVLPSTPVAATENTRPTTVSDTPSRKTSKPSRSPRRQKTNTSVPCVEC